MRCRRSSAFPHLVMTTILGVSWCAVFSADTRPDSPDKRNELELVALPPGKPADQIRDILKDSDWYMRHMKLRILGRTLGSTDPKAGWDLVGSSFVLLPDRQAFKLPLLQAWGRNNPQEALAAAEQVPLGERRAMALAAVLEGWATLDPEKAAAWLDKNLTGIYRRLAAGQVGAAWALSDPKKAADWALGTKDEPSRVFVMNEVLENWVETSGRDATKWASELRDARMRDLAMSKAVFDWAEHVPQTAAEFLLHEDPDYVWMLPRVLARWGKYDPETASRWLANVPDKKLVQDCYLALVQEWAMEDAPTALEWARTHMNLDPLIVSNPELVGSWPENSTLKALEWTGKLSSPEARQAAAEKLIENWSIKDPQSFQEWVQSERPGMRKDIGLHSLANMQGIENPAEAMKTAMGIQDETRRNEALKLHYEFWKESAPEAAAAWLKANPEAAKFVQP